MPVELSAVAEDPTTVYEHWSVFACVCVRVCVRVCVDSLMGFLNILVTKKDNYSGKICGKIKNY